VEQVVHLGPAEQVEHLVQVVLLVPMDQVVHQEVVVQVVHLGPAEQVVHPAQVEQVVQVVAVVRLAQVGPEVVVAHLVRVVLEQSLEEQQTMWQYSVVLRHLLLDQYTTADQSLK
jgi:hypothetical protein